MNVLVVGGAGYIGSHCVRMLSAAGHRPVVLDNLVYGHRAAVADGVTLHTADLGDENPAVAAVLEREKIELVMHFAAFCYVGGVRHRPPQVLPEQPGGHVASVQRDGQDGRAPICLLLDLRHLRRPGHAPYRRDRAPGSDQPLRADQVGRGKRVARARPRREGVVRRLPVFQRGGRRRGRIDRRGSRSRNPPYPPGDRCGDRQARPSLRLFGTDYDTPDGTCLRDYVHVDDLSRAHIAVFDRLAQPAQPIFTIWARGSPSSNREVIRAVEGDRALIRVIEGPRRPGDPPALCTRTPRCPSGLRVES